MKKIILFPVLLLSLFMFSACDIKKEVDQNKEVLQTPTSEVENNQENTVPLPQGEDIIRSFFSLINEKRIPEAISMMTNQAVPDDSAKQAWGVQFNAIKSINVQAIEPANQASWTENSKEYKVTLEAYVSSEAANAPIPYYGWEDNPNIRWVTIIKNENGIWQIDQIGTGL